MERPIANGFIDDDITITDLDVVKARRVGADPGLVLDGSSLATEIRKRNQITFTTLATAGKCILHVIASFLLKRDSIRPPDHEMRERSARSKPRGSLRRCIRIPTAIIQLVSAVVMIPQIFLCVSRLMK
jgi:hypothetical protein